MTTSSDAPALTPTSATTDPHARVCTIRNRELARAVFAALVAVGLIGGTWLATALLAGPYIADSLLVEAFVASTVLLTGVALAASLSRALGCGHCHTPDCTCL
jgi:hypothetical protein